MRGRAQFDLASALAASRERVQRLSLHMHAGCGFGGMHACARTLRRLDLEIEGDPPPTLDLSALELLRRRARRPRRARRAPADGASARQLPWLRLRGRRACACARRARAARTPAARTAAGADGRGRTDGRVDAGFSACCARLRSLHLALAPAPGAAPPGGAARGAPCALELPGALEHLEELQLLDAAGANRRACEGS